MSQVNLDDPKTYVTSDPFGMLHHIHDISMLCQKAWRQALTLDLPQRYSRVNKIAIFGMGGSAIGGDLLSSLVIGECKVPISVHRGYIPPAFIDENTLVIASSYSGNTEETLAAFEAIPDHHTPKIVMTSGGELAGIAQKHDLPAFIFDYQSPPRAAMPLSFLALLGILHKLELIADKSADVAEACEVMDRLSETINETSPEQENPAKQLARRLYGNMAIIYGAEHLAEVASRWKIQINENAKGWAGSAVFPELNHNSTTGYAVPKEISEKTFVIMLRSESLHPRILLRYGITSKLLDRHAVKHETLTAIGKNKLAQMFSLILFGDYASYYLALLYGIDPYPIEAVDYLKRELGKSKQSGS
ncbi:MAG: bifunctional phosphoglucose/phosphomannose isomerase [Dehalococcoidia bacterium]|nr:bifunctional phosphoglucose/phosphomannose isomerase [Dehalococcoidia bacterium]